MGRYHLPYSRAFCFFEKLFPVSEVVSNIETCMNKCLVANNRKYMHCI